MFSRDEEEEERCEVRLVILGSIFFLVWISWVSELLCMANAIDP